MSTAATAQFIATPDNNTSDDIDITGDSNNNRVTIDNTFGVVNARGIQQQRKFQPAGDQMIVVGTSGDDTLFLTPSDADSADTDIRSAQQ